MTVTSFEKAILFLGSALEQDSVPPTVVALSDGGVQPAWYRNGIDVEATFPEATEADLYIRDRAADAESVRTISRGKRSRFSNATSIVSESESDVSASREDDPSIDGAARLYRRVHPNFLRRDEERDCVRLMSGAFQHVEMSGRARRRCRGEGAGPSFTA